MNYSIILAAGKGKRLKIKDPIKPLLMVKGLPIFLHSTKTFVANKNIDRVILVINKEYQKTYLDCLRKAKLDKKVNIVIGSDKLRHLSLIAAMNYLIKNNNLQPSDIIITHDAARINVAHDLIDENILTTKKYGFASTIFPIYDSICEIKLDCKYIDRDNKYIVQTPQTFQYKYWKNKSQQKHITDLFTFLNLKVKKENLVIGSWNNFKITTKNDLKEFTL